MGLLFNFIKPPKDNLEAALQPFNIPDFNQFSFLSELTNTTVNRAEAMSVPSVSRGRNIITGTIASIPLELRGRDMSRLPLPRFIEQPDPRVPASVVYAYTAEDLLFTGAAYWQVLEMDETTGRPSKAQWVAANLVLEELDPTGRIIVGYTYDGKRTPDKGVGSLIRFTGLDEGFLNRAGRTVKTAAALERAVLNYAKEPTPSVILKSGNPLSRERVQALLDTWRNARNHQG